MTNTPSEKEEQIFMNETPATAKNSTSEGQFSLTQLLDQIAARANAATPAPWDSRFLLYWCRPTAQDLGNGLHVLTGDFPCRFKEGSCSGHNNENWSLLVGPDTYRERPDGKQYVFSNDSQFIAAARSDVPKLVKALRRATEMLVWALSKDVALMEHRERELVQLLSDSPLDNKKSASVEQEKTDKG